jgi:hypothetical protein
MWSAVSLVSACAVLQSFVVLERTLWNAAKHVFLEDLLMCNRIHGAQQSPGEDNVPDDEIDDCEVAK